MATGWREATREARGSAEILVGNVLFCGKDDQ